MSVHISGEVDSANVDMPLGSTKLCLKREVVVLISRHGKVMYMNSL